MAIWYNSEDYIRRVAQLAGMVLCICLCVSFRAAAGQVDPLGEPFFETVGDASVIPDGSVWAVAQDQQGLLWIGTQNGLLRYDGYRYRYFRHEPGNPNSLSHDFVRELLATQDGRLWIATHGGGVAVYDPVADSFLTIRHDPDAPDSLSSDVVLSLIEDEQGGVWLGTSNGLNYWHPKTHRIDRYVHQPGDDTSINHHSVRSLLFDSRGDLWVGTRDGLNLRRAGSDHFEQIAHHADGLSGQYVYEIHESSDGRIWVGTQAAGAGWVDPHQLTFHALPLGEALGGVSHPWVNGFVEPLPGTLWMSTFGGGIDIYDLHSDQVIRRVRNDPAELASLANNYATQPYQDRSGILWLMPWGGGLQRHNPLATAFRSLRYSYTHNEGLSDPTVLSVLELDNGLIWLGTGGNGIDILDRQTGVVGGYRPDPHQPGAMRDGTIRAMAQTPDGTIWVGTQQDGLYRFLGPEQGFEQIQDSKNIPDNRMRRMLVSRSGKLLIGSQTALSELDPANGEVRLLSLPDNSVFEHPVWALAEQADGTLWIGTPGGLMVRRPGEHHLQMALAELSHPTVRTLLVDNDDQLWVMTPMGLEVLLGWLDDRPLFEPLELHGQRFEQPGNFLFDDGRGRLWSDRYMFDLATREVYNFSRADGVDLSATPMDGSASMTRDGIFIFGGSKGVLVVDPAAFQPWDYQPPVVVTELRIDGAVRSLGELSDGLQITAQQRSFSIEFAALDYSTPERNLYRYILEGYDTHWIDSEARQRIASYGNLWPGNYLLRVRGSNRAGQWSEHELIIPIRVLPAYWQTPWFAGILLLLLISLVAAGSHWRTARIRGRARELQVLVDQRTAALAAEKQRLEATLVELQSTQQQLLVAEKMASLGQLVAGVAHEMNTPLGVAITASSILAEETERMLKEIDGGTLKRSTLVDCLTHMQNSASIVDANLQRAANLVGSFKQVSVDRDSEGRRQFFLDDLLRDLVTTLEANWRPRPIRLLLKGDASVQMDSYPGILTRILSHFTQNALMHAFEPEQVGLLCIETRELADGYIEIIFSDNGKGMDEEQARQVFDPFYTTRRGQGATGLGLHIVFNLVNAHLGGTIEVDSAPGKGTRFILSIPRIAP